MNGANTSAKQNGSFVGNFISRLSADDLGATTTSDYIALDKLGRKGILLSDGCDCKKFPDVEAKKLSRFSHHMQLAATFEVIGADLEML